MYRYYKLIFSDLRSKKLHHQTVKAVFVVCCLFIVIFLSKKRPARSESF